MQNRLASLFVVTVVFIGINASAQGPFAGKPQYQIEVKRADTVMGNIIVEMFPAIAPMSVRNWDSLVNIKFYDSTAFHRVIPGFMIQGGDPNSVDGDPSTWGYGDPSQTTVDAEFSAVSHRRGILSAARVGGQPNSATSQFFICVANPTYLDRQYSVYGHVVSGMNVADSIVKADRDPSNDMPYDKISMYVTRIGSNDSVSPVPIASMPPDGFISSSSRVSFRWSILPSVMMYDIRIAKDSALQNVVIDTTYNQVTSSASLSGIKPGTYYWRIQANNGGRPSDSPVWQFTVEAAGVRDGNENAFSVNGPYPNPATTSATISISNAPDANISVNIEDMCGRTVRSETVKATSEIILPTNKLPAGVYLCHVECNGLTAVRKLVVE